VLNLSSLEPELNKLAHQIKGKQHTSELLLERLSTLLENTQKLENCWRPGNDEGLFSATPLEKPNSKIIPSARPELVTLCATDGSQIFPDHNINIFFSLINISHICFQIGSTQPPVLTNKCRFYSTESLKTHPIFQGLNFQAEQYAEFISPLRQLMELEDLLELCKSNKIKNRPLLALSDGTLIMWYIKKLQHARLQDRFFKAYNQILYKFRTQKQPLISYISFPNGQDVVKSLQKCFKDDFDGINIENWLYDRDIFSLLLKPGERSGTFESFSEVLTHVEPPDKICFFYLHTGKEIARVEFPVWCYHEDKNILEMIHSCLMDDLNKGSGYPMMLSEAHEKAVISNQDQTNFYRYLEYIGQKEGLNIKYSAKSLSKRLPKI